MDPQVIFEDSKEFPLIIDMTDVNSDLPVYGRITKAIMDDDTLPKIEILADGYLFSEKELDLDKETEKFYTDLMFERFKNIIEKSLENILGGAITKEAINEYNSLTPEELEERKCQRLRNH